MIPKMSQKRKRAFGKFPGSRVGMSQYGAQAMAQAGSGYEEILLHYYTGVSLENYFQQS